MEGRCLPPDLDSPSPRRSRSGNCSLSAIWCSVPSLTRLARTRDRSEEHTSELQSRPHLVCRLLLEKKKKKNTITRMHETHLSHISYILRTTCTGADTYTRR